MKKYIYSVLLGLFTQVNAAEVKVSEIVYIAPWPNHVDVKMNADYVKGDCENSNDSYRIDLTEGESASIRFSTLLAAFMASKNVGLSLDGCVGNKPRIVGVRLNKQ